MAKKKVVAAESKLPEAPQHQRRCKLCPDGGNGKPLVEVTDAARQKAWACVQHAAFYGRERTNSNRKYLPGNEQIAQRVKPVVTVPDTDEDEEDDGPKIRMRDRK